MKILYENGMYAAVAEPGKVINHGNGYCYKLYRKTDEFTDCTEVDASEVPEAEEPLDETEAKAQAYDILTGGAE